MVSFGTPHDPWAANNVPAEFYDLFKDVEFPLPPNYSDEIDPYGDDWSNIKKGPAEIDEWMRNYYAMTANLDWNIGRMLEAVDKAGLADDTIVVFTSDHGEMFGAHGRRKKNIFYEEAARVPFLMRWPGRIPAGRVSDACLNTPDIMPTLLGLAGLARIPESVEGMDLSHLALGKAGPEPEAALLMNTGACAVWEDGHEWRALRDKRFTYAVYRGGGHEPSPQGTAVRQRGRPAPDEEPRRRPGPSARHGEVPRDAQGPNGPTERHVPRVDWYRDHWTDGNRRITANAHGPFPAGT